MLLRELHLSAPDIGSVISVEAGNGGDMFS
jgi:hypothetical protein